METDRRNFAVRFLLFVRCPCSNSAAAGWLTGLCCGLLLCGILLAVGLFWQGTAGSPVRLLLICGGSIWGGISGVNAPHKKPPK